MIDGRNVRLLAMAAIVVSGWALSAATAYAQEGRYGDSTWVAPYPIAEDPGDPSAPGPRVRERDHEPVGETILRTPFRLVGLPFRLLARGLEASAPWIGPKLLAPPGRFGIRTPVAIISPTITFSSNTGTEPGFSIHRPPYREDIPDVSIHGSWSTRDQRRASGRIRIGSDTTLWSGGFGAKYRFTPNFRVYGVGNSVGQENESHYLAEQGELNSWVGVAYGPRRKITGEVGISGSSSRRGYNGTGPFAEDLLGPGELPGYGQNTHVAWYGLVGEWAVVNHGPDPYRGVHAIAEVRRMRATDETHLRYIQWQTELRGYIPVFADRRVIGIRLLYGAANPDAGSSPIPFDRLPSSTDEFRFGAFRNREFRDQQIALGQLEYRWVIVRDVQFYLMAQLGEVASSSGRMRWADAHESYGGGLRYAPPHGAPIRIQIASGAEGTSFQLGLSGSF